MITYFWTWITTTTTAALTWLNTIINSSVVGPFFQLALIVFATMMIFKYIVYPLLSGGTGSSDKVKKKEDE